MVLSGSDLKFTDEMSQNNCYNKHQSTKKKMVIRVDIRYQGRRQKLKDKSNKRNRLPYLAPDAKNSFGLASLKGSRWGAVVGGTKHRTSVQVHATNPASTGLNPSISENCCCRD